MFYCNTPNLVSAWASSSCARGWKFNRFADFALWNTQKCVWRPGSTRTLWGSYSAPSRYKAERMERRERKGLEIGRGSGGKGRTWRGEEGWEGEKRVRGRKGAEVGESVGKGKRMARLGVPSYATASQPQEEHLSRPWSRQQIILRRIACIAYKWLTHVTCFMVCLCRHVLGGR